MRVLQSLQSWAISDVACGDTTDDCNMMCATGGGRQAAVGASVCSKCSAADKHANWCATWVKCCWLWEIYVRIADSCQKWAARRDSETAVCICSSICKHYNDPTTSGPDGIISTGVANFSVQPDETEHELGWLSSCYAALCHFTWLRLRLWLWAVWFH